MNSGMSLSSQVSVDIGVVRGTAHDGMIDLRLTLFSSAAKWANVALLYKSQTSTEWQEDMAIIASNSRFISGNTMMGLPCSSQGSESRCTWKHATNGIASGSRVNIKAVIVPSPVVSSVSGSFSRIETLIQNGNRIISSGTDGHVVGFDPMGNIISIDDRGVCLTDQDTGNVELSIPSMSHAIHAVGSSNGVVVIEPDGMITEYNMDGDVVRTFDASSMATGDTSISLHLPTGNLLISGGNIPQVNEISWGGPSHGQLLWSYTDFVLDRPSGAVYGDGLDTILFCDRGNHRVAVVDRRSSPQQTSFLSTIDVGGVSVAMRAPAWCAMAKDVVYVVEGSGKSVPFENDPSSHPALVRSGFVPSSGENALPQYAGMCFVPIIRSIK